MLLYGTNAPCHSKPGVANYRNASSQGFASGPTPIPLVIIINQSDNIIKIVPAYVVSSVGIILEAGIAADMYGASDHKLARVEAMLTALASTQI
jgi:hypothetical protein